MSTIDRYCHLWDGSEPGWVLLRIHQHRVRLSIAFQGAGPGVEEVKAIRNAVPAHAARPASEVLASLRGQSSIDLGDYDDREARRVAEACRALGLAVREQFLDCSGYLPFNERTNVTVIIEDDVLSRQVCEAALSHGLRVRDVES